MLPFGSFFTQLPLLVIGLLYMLYLGLNVAGKEKTGIAESSLQTVETGSSAVKIDYFTLAAMPFHSPAEKSEPSFIAPAEFVVKNFIFPDKEDFPKISFYDFRIFSRPPPEA